MTTTDMCNAKSKVWYNYGINLLKSDDLIHWTAVTFDFRKGASIFCDAESPDFYNDYSVIQRVWAPQIIWDKNYIWNDGSKGGYMIYYSLLNSKEDKYDRIFYSYADESFTKLTKPRLLLDWGYATIDADINYVAADGRYHLLIKKEGGKRGIFTSSSDKLTGVYPQPDEADYVSFEGNKQCEGASAFQLAGDSTWRVGYVEYTSRPAKYRICKADNYLRNFHSPEDIQGVANPQHGSFVTLTKEEYQRLQKWSDEKTGKKTEEYPQSILPGDYPDPSIIRDSKDFYMTHSKNWKTLAENVDVSAMNHNNFGGFYALRPALVSAGKGDAKFFKFEYLKLD
jgi:beta-xylosidase